MRKTFGSVVAVDDLHLRVRHGEFYAFLGPNGAGKTTTLRMIAGLLRPHAGSVWIQGISLQASPAEAKRQLAYIPDDPLLYGKLRPLEYLEFVAALWGLPRAAAQPKAESCCSLLGFGKSAATTSKRFPEG